MSDILQRLESHNEYSESGDARQLRKDAAEEIRQLRQQVAALNNLLLRQASNKMSRRAVA